MASTELYLKSGLKRFWLPSLIPPSLTDLSNLIRNSQGKNLRTFCLFIGHPRSGHTLVSALLDFHPKVQLSQELEAAELFLRKVPTPLVFYMISNNSLRFAHNGKQWSRYRYSIAGAQKKEGSQLQVIGDKDGQYTAELFFHNAGLYQILKTRIGLDIKIINVIRNPFDTIATRVNRIGISLDRAINDYEKLQRAVQVARKQIPEQSLITVKLTEFIGNPRSGLRKLCAFLGCHAGNEYLDRCTEIVWEKAKVTRGNVTWSEEQRRRVEKVIEGDETLRGYGFEE